MPISKVYLVDLIGSYAGMDYYDMSFVQEIQNEQIEINILSTFSLSDEKPFLKVMFKKSKFLSILLMFQNYLRLLLFILRHRRSVYVFMSYGEITDFLFFTLGLIPNKFFVDIHELYAVCHGQDSWVTKVFNWYYRNIIKYVIFHSDKTLEGLQKLGYVGVTLFVPHFKYGIKSGYDEANIGSDISNLFSTSKTKMLFFGNIRKIKGIDIVVDYILDHKGIENKAEFVIAGKNVEHIDFDEIRNVCSVIDRHINDDELKFLYSKTDYVLLPYRDSSQSGVLEMAFCFKKPMLLSNIPYFSKIILKYPSFGEIKDIKDFSELLDKVITGVVQKEYYSEIDCNKFLLRREIEDFRNRWFCAIV